MEGLILNWTQQYVGAVGYEEAVLMNPDGEWGVRMSIQYQITCYRRGKYKLLIEINHGVFHDAWGCFDEADQPMRYYHDLDRCKAEANAIAHVLMNDFIKRVTV